ncbi:hypothetical protein V8E54_003247 [Elaphomyces granulatus]
MVPWTLYWNFRFIVSTGFLSNSEDQIESILRRRTFLDEFPNGKSVPGYCWMRLTVMISLRLRNIGENALEYGPDMLLNQLDLDTARPRHHTCIKAASGGFMWDTRIGLIGDRNQSEEKILDERIAITGLSDEAAISLPWLILS